MGLSRPRRRPAPYQLFPKKWSDAQGWKATSLDNARKFHLKFTVAEYGLDRSNRADVLADLKAFYDGYRFLPDAEPLYNSTICNWYLFNFVSCKGRQPTDIIDSNVRTDIGWFRRLAQTSSRALEKLRGYIERGEGEGVVRSALSSKFGRAKFFSEEFFPYALYYLGLPSIAL